MTSERHPPGLPSGSSGDDSAAGGAPPEERLAPDLEAIVHGFVSAQTAPGTRLMYEKYLRYFLASRGIRTAAGLLSVRSQDVVDYRNELQRQGLGNSTVNGRISALRGLFGKLQAEAVVPGNPAARNLVKGLDISDVSRTEGLSLEEVRAILATCDGTLRGLRDRAILMTLFYEGLRRSEASKLRYRDLIGRRGMLEVKQAKKNPYSTVVLRPEVRQAIDDYLEVLNRDLAKFETRPEDPVFVSLSRRSFGRPLAADSMNEMVKKRVAMAGIDRKISAHSWRHTCTTQALIVGTPLHQVQRHLRHKTIQTTLRYDREREARNNPTSGNLPSVSV